LRIVHIVLTGEFFIIVLYDAIIYIVLKQHLKIVKLDMIMSEKYDLDELLENPGKPLTDEQFKNWRNYMALTNDDKSASEVDISDRVAELCEEMDRRGTYCW